MPSVILPAAPHHADPTETTLPLATTGGREA
jgi:hypothetical protein